MKSDPFDLPLVSICITCYNQSTHVCEAIDSALKQSYEKCEVVIADDCSTDGSDEVIRKFIASYRASGGVRSIIYHRNDHNLRIAKNYEKCFKLAHGELLITGSGDDVSLPNRASKIVEAWLASGKTAACIATGCRRIDDDGSALPDDDFLGVDADHPLGAVQAYDKRVVTEFAEIEKVDAFEDAVFTRRALMFGVYKRIYDKLVLYRATGVCSCKKMKEGVRAATVKSSWRTLEGIIQALHDLEGKRAKLSTQKYLELRKRFKWMELCYKYRYKMVTGANILTRFFFGVCYMKSNYGVASLFSRRFILVVIPRILPKNAYEFLKGLVGR